MAMGKKELMRQALRLRVAAGLLAIMLAPVAVAQPPAPIGVDAARSVDSAQQFLQQVLPGNGYASTPMSQMLAAARREQLRGHFEPLPVITRADPLRACVSVLLADAGDSWFIVRNPHDSGDVSEAAVADLFGGDGLIGNPEGLHFGDIRALSQSGNRVQMRLAGNRDDAVLHLEGEQAASRVLAALQYLQQTCDSSR